MGNDIILLASLKEELEKLAFKVGWSSSGFYVSKRFKWNNWREPISNFKLLWLLVTSRTLDTILGVAVNGDDIILMKLIKRWGVYPDFQSSVVVKVFGACYSVRNHYNVDSGQHFFKFNLNDPSCYNSLLDEIVNFDFFKDHSYFSFLAGNRG